MGLVSLELEKAVCDTRWDNHLHHSQSPRYRFQSLQIVPRTFLQALQLYEIIMKKV